MWGYKMIRTVGISTQTYDLNGAVLVRGITPDAEQENRNVRRRVTRTATLDGGCALYDTGYSASDRDILVEVDNPTDTLYDALQYLCRTYNLLTVAVRDGVFIVAPESCQIVQGKLQLRCLVKEALS